MVIGNEKLYFKFKVATICCNTCSILNKFIYNSSINKYEEIDLDSDNFHEFEQLSIMYKDILTSLNILLNKD